MGETHLHGYGRDELGNDENQKVYNMLEIFPWLISKLYLQVLHGPKMKKKKKKKLDVFSVDPE